MATYNIEDGTGGIDASILYELDRSQVMLLIGAICGVADGVACIQNIGAGMPESLIDFNLFNHPMSNVCPYKSKGIVLIFAL